MLINSLILRRRKTNKIKLNNNGINFDNSKNSEYKNDNLSKKNFSQNENNNTNIIDIEKSYNDNQIKKLIDEDVISIDKKDNQEESFFDIIILFQFKQL